MSSQPPVCPECGRTLAAVSARLGAFSCRACDTVRIVPQPDELELAALYGRDYYASWGEADASSGYWQLKLALFRHLLRAAAPFPVGCRALDIGCATGAGLAVIAELGLQPVGIDINPYAVEIARRQVPEATIFGMPLEQAPLENASFGLILLSDVVEHVRDPLDFLTRVAALLTPDGRVAIVTPDIGSWSARLMKGRWSHLKREHLTLFGRQAMADLCRCAGLETESIRALPKPLSLDYAARQFTSYPLPLITPLLRLAMRLAPQRLATLPLFLPMGEILVVARPTSRLSQPTACDRDAELEPPRLPQ